MALNKVFDTFMTHVYNTEDSLYQILYDKSYRPEVYKLKTSSMTTTEPQVDLNKFGTIKEPGAVSFIETRFLEQVNSTRVGLIQKFPMIMFSCLSIYLARRLVVTHTQLLTHS
jgi:hypothetical protein